MMVQYYHTDYLIDSVFTGGKPGKGDQFVDSSTKIFSHRSGRDDPAAVELYRNTLPEEAFQEESYINRYYTEVAIAR